MNRILVTGAAGFIGYHLSSKLMENGYQVIGLDNLNDYYDVRLKQARLEQLASKRGQFHSIRWTSRYSQYPESVSRSETRCCR